ncbi:MAG: STAS/SEC14 domain-containing protein [Thiohalomonadales bacterium]
MPATHSIDNKAKLIVTTWRGEAIDTEFIDALKNYQKNIQGNPTYQDYNEIFDFRKVAGIKISAEGIKNISRIASSTDQEDSDRRLAIIVGSNLAFGLARMYVTYRSFQKQSNKEIRIFKIEKNAYEWVKVGLLERL